MLSCNCLFAERHALYRRKSMIAAIIASMEIVLRQLVSSVFLFSKRYKTNITRPRWLALNKLSTTSSGRCLFSIAPILHIILNETTIQIDVDASPDDCSKHFPRRLPKFLQFSFPPPPSLTHSRNLIVLYSINPQKPIPLHAFSCRILPAYSSQKIADVELGT